MANPQLEPFITQLGVKTLGVVVVGAVLMLPFIFLRVRFEAWIERKVREWKSARHAKRYEGMSDEQVLNAPHCPSCNGSMILRTARKGVNAGEKFWGCGAFPKCRGTRKTSSL
jgi:hypothetical protein